MTRTTPSIALVLVVLVGLTTVSFLGVTVAQQTTTVTVEAESTDPGASTTHVVVVPIDENTTGDVEGVRIDYGDAGVDTREIDDNRIEEFGIDRDGDEPGDAVDVRLDDDITDIESLDGGRVLSVEAQGGRLARVGDEVVLSYRIPNPPEAGTYAVNVTYNPRTIASQYVAVLRVGDVPTTAEPTPTFTPSPTPRAEATPSPTRTSTASPTPMPTPTPEPTPEPTAVPADETTTTEATPTETTETESPGFGVSGALVALAVLSGVLWQHGRRGESR